jgi:hypothetical protein
MDQFDEEVVGATLRAKERLRSDPRAVAARYDRGQIVVDLSTGYQVSFAAARAQGLAGASSSDLAEIEIIPSGYGLHWPGSTPIYGFRHCSRACLVRVLGWQRASVLRAEKSRAMPKLRPRARTAKAADGHARPRHPRAKSPPKRNPRPRAQSNQRAKSRARRAAGKPLPRGEPEGDHFGH